jgi:mRNA-degrading endonuclease RelE of RelBE toxin-antitoxin system
VSSSKYELFLESKAFSFVLNLSRSEGRFIESVLDYLLLNPNQDADYTRRDDDGRTVLSLIVGAYVIEYWVDEAVRRVNITRIESAD